MTVEVEASLGHCRNCFGTGRRCKPVCAIAILAAFGLRISPGRSPCQAPLPEPQHEYMSAPRSKWAGHELESSSSALLSAVAAPFQLQSWERLAIWMHSSFR